MAQSDVQLVIRAIDESSATLKKVAEQTHEFVKANKAVSDQANETDSTLSLLRDEVTKLATALSSLTKANDVASIFEKSVVAARQSKQVMVEARQALEQHVEAERKASAVATEAAERQRANAAAIERTTQAIKALTAVKKSERTDDQTAQLEKERASLASLKEERKKLNAEVRDTGKALSEQSRNTERARASLEKARLTHSEATAEANKHARALKEAGVSTRNLSGLQSELKTAITEASASLAATEQNIKDYNNALAESERRYKAYVELEERRGALRKREADETAAFERKASEARNLVQAAEYVNWWTDALNKADQAEREATDRKLFEQKARDAQQAVRAAEYINWWTEALQKQDAELAKNAQSHTARAQALGRASSVQKNAASGISIFEDNSRKAMSVLQRLRGELITLTMTYVGLYGAINQVSGALKKYMEFEAAQARFSVILADDAERLGEEFAFVSSMADRLGLDLSVLERTYSKFFTVTQQQGIGLDETRTIFEALAESATVLRMSNEDLEGSLKAVEQMFSKGAIQAEELKGQLGDRMPGAVKIMADALGVGTDELMKMMEQGQLTSDMMLKFALQTKDIYGKGLPAATESFRAELNRLVNEWTRLQRAFGKDASEELVGPMRELREIVASPEFKEGAQGLAKALGAVAQAAVWAVENIDLLAKVVGGLLALKAAGVIIGIAMSFVTMARNVLVAADNVRVFGKALGLLTRVLGIVGLALAAIQVAKYFWDEFPQVQKFAVNIKAVFLTAVASIQKFFKELGANIQYFFEAPISAIRTKISELIRFLADVARTIPSIGEDIASGLGAAANIAAPGNNSETRQYHQKMKLYEQQYQDELTGIVADAQLERAIIDEEFLEKRNAQKRSADADAIQAEELSEKERNERLARAREDANRRRLADEKDANEKIAKEREKLRDELTRITNEIAEIEANNLQDAGMYEEALRARFKIIEAEYADLLKRLMALGDTQGVALVQRRMTLEMGEVGKAIAEAYKSAEIEKFEKAEERLNQLIEYRRVLIENINIQRENGSMSEREAMDSIASLSQSLYPQIEQLTNEAIAAAEALRNINGDAWTDTTIQNLRNVVSELGKVKTYADSVADSLGSDIIGGITDSVVGLVKGLGEAVVGAVSLGDAFKSAWDTFRNFAADFLLKIARMIAEAAILKALNSALGLNANSSMSQTSGAIGNTIVSFLGSFFHTGGVVGQKHDLRPADPAWFLNAQRFHTGGLPGLKPDEVPAILQKGEEVLTRDDPRNVLNGGSGTQSTSNQNLRIVNVVDPALARDYLESSAGEKVIMNLMQRNAESLRSILSA